MSDVKNNLYTRFARSALETWLLANGYTFHILPKHDDEFSDYIISKPKTKPFALEFKIYSRQNERIFLNNTNKAKKKYLGVDMPVYYIGIDEKNEEIAIEDGLAKKLKGQVPGLTVKKKK